MTESELESTCSQCLDDIRRAFDEVEKKGAADESIVIKHVSRLIAEADRIMREHTTKHDYVARSAALRQQLEHEVRKLAETGRADTARVMKRVHASTNTMGLVSQLRPELADVGVKHIVDRVVASQKRAEAAAATEDVNQLDLAFDNIDEFRRVRKVVLLYVDPQTGKIEHIPYSKSREKHRLQSIERHERKAVTEDQQAKREKEIEDLLSPLVKKYGDLSPAELWAKKLQDDKKRGRA
jgi:hypothetical protein